MPVRGLAWIYIILAETSGTSFEIYLLILTDLFCDVLSALFSSSTSLVDMAVDGLKVECQLVPDVRT